MPELAENSKGADIFLSSRGTMARCHVVMLSHVVNGKVMDRSHIMAILDTRMYQVELGGGDITELLFNVTSKSMYAQCDADGNEYLLLSSCIYY